MGGFSDFSAILAAMHISRMNSNEMDGDRPGQPANRIAIGCRTSHKLCSNYLFTLIKLVVDSVCNRYQSYV